MNTNTLNEKQKAQVMNVALPALLTEIKEYIERTEVRIDLVWGSCRSLEELQRGGAMPELYKKICGILSHNTELNRDSPACFTQKNEGFDTKARPSAPCSADFVMPFGKYRGWTLG